jgi:lipase ATG15
MYAAEQIAQEILINYPNASVWFTGHSLGAGLASLLTASLFQHKIEPRIATICFESPGEKLYAQRMGFLPTAQPDEPEKYAASDLPIFHIFNDADPVPYGKCTGPLSTCYLAGYALESACHLGTYKTCQI